MILDVETFDYAYFPRASGGLKISLADARDKAVINQDGSYLSPGVNFINIFREFFCTKVLFLTRKSCQNVTFVQKRRAKNIDKIDAR